MPSTIKPNNLHYVTQEGQPYGSVCRCCQFCGAMCWPGVEGSAKRWTDSLETWVADPNNCKGPEVTDDLPSDLDLIRSI